MLLIESRKNGESREVSSILCDHKIPLKLKEKFYWMATSLAHRMAFLCWVVKYKMCKV